MAEEEGAASPSPSEEESWDDGWAERKREKIECIWVASSLLEVNLSAHGCLYRAKILRTG
jgi:hypothetical protein